MNCEEIYTQVLNSENVGLIFGPNMGVTFLVSDGQI